MKRLFFALCLMSLMALPAFGQVTCTRLGAYTDCSGPNNQSGTQVQLGPNQGVIITDRDTVPYTVLSPAPTIIDPVDPLPSLTPLPTLGAPAAGGTGGTSDLMPLFAPMDSPLIILGQ